jgi:23S rRNA (pseudouridine1915-N3)-methyltransferase
MEINIYINRKKIQPECVQAVREYIKRLSPYCSLNVNCQEKPEVPCDNIKVKCFALSRIKKSPANYYTENYYNFTEKDIADKSDCNSLPDESVHNFSPSSTEFARLINDITLNGCSSLNFYVGYDENITDHMDTFSVATLSLSCDMVTVLLSEQIYRAFTILKGITYHK